ncbi:MAG: PAS domain S-box protein [Bacteroidetes bacterium]|nr:PAS domain S-box protein [Bacteroidota bacterium]MBS1648720.1 PAS domain S-box protein [Bacteroidota bacterium]
MKPYKTYYAILALILVILILLSGVISFLSVNETAAIQKGLGVSANRYSSLLMHCITVISLIALFILHRKSKHRAKLITVAEQLHNIINHSGDAIISTNFDLTIISWNKGAEQLFRYPDTKAIGKNLATLINSEITGVLRHEIWTELKKNNYWKHVSTFSTPNNKNITALFSISTIRDINKKNKIIGFTCICTDMTFQKNAEEKISQLATMVEASNDAIVTFNDKLEILSWNKGAERLYGYKSSESIGKLMPELLSHQDSTLFLKATIKNLTSKGYWKSEDIHYNKNGEKINVLISFSSFNKTNNNIYLGIITDITEQKEVEQKLLQFNKTLEEKVLEKTAEMREIFDRVDWGFSAFNINGDFIFVNPKAEELMQVQAKELIGKHIWKAFPNAGEDFRTTYSTAIKTQKTQYLETYASSLSKWLACFFFASTNGVSIYFRDITERKKLQQERIDINTQLRTLAAHQEKIREEERKKMAGELHDELGQLITSIKIDAEWLNKRINENDIELKKKTQDIIEISSETAIKIRDLAKALRPRILDDLGLIPALEWLFLDFKKRSQINIEFHHSIDDIHVNEETSTHVFRIVQESLTNIAKHANADKVTCDITTHKNNLYLFLNDNGKGFDIKAKTNTFGLLGMKERVKLINGTININSVINAGTEITLEIPL